MERLNKPLSELKRLLNLCLRQNPAATTASCARSACTGPTTPAATGVPKSTSPNAAKPTPCVTCARHAAW